MLEQREYKIIGWDSVLGEWYERPERYDTAQKAQERCRSNEAPEPAE